jgi:nucleoid-associated protein YgaU
MATKKPHKKAKKVPPIKKLPVAPYHIKFTAPGFSDVTVLLDETPIQVSSGYGGWTVTSRLRRTGLTMWTGKDPLRMSVPILFDGYLTDTSQEIPISRLSRMGLPPTKGISGGDPTIVQISGNAVPPAGPKNWVIENIAWGTNVVWDTDQNGALSRMRQDAVVNLLQYVADDLVAFSRIPVGQASGNPSKPGTKGYQKSVRLKKGETLRQLANRVYKSPKPNDYRLITAANGIRDPRSVKPGTLLRIPKK